LTLGNSVGYNDVGYTGQLGGYCVDIRYA